MFFDNISTKDRWIFSNNAFCVSWSFSSPIISVLWAEYEIRGEEYRCQTHGDTLGRGLVCKIRRSCYFQYLCTCHQKWYTKIATWNCKRYLTVFNRSLFITCVLGIRFMLKIVIETSWNTKNTQIYTFSHTDLYNTNNAFYLTHYSKPNLVSEQKCEFESKYWAFENK